MTEMLCAILVEVGPVVLEKSIIVNVFPLRSPFHKNHEPHFPGPMMYLTFA